MGCPCAKQQLSTDICSEDSNHAMEGAVSFSGQIYPENTVGYFRLASESGRAPIEPVCQGEFLIGSGPQCQLRLGGPGVPEVHTILIVEAQSITVKPLESQPSLVKNGSPCETGPLEDGDLLELDRKSVV